MSDIISFLILVGALVSAIVSLVMIFRRPKVMIGGNVCRCGYSRVGLAAGAVCPECGALEPDRHTSEQERAVWAGRMGLKWLLGAGPAVLGFAAAIAGPCSQGHLDLDAVLFVSGFTCWPFLVLGVGIPVLFGSRLNPRSLLCMSVCASGTAAALCVLAYVDSFIIHTSSTAPIVILFLGYIGGIGGGYGLLLGTLATMAPWFRKPA